MKKLLHIFFPISLLFIFIFSCRKDDEEWIELERYSGGKNGTVFDETANAFGNQMPGINADNELIFFVGNSFFNQNWVSAPASTTARDGVGPIMNARNCSACHFKDGRGQPFLADGDEALGFLIRLSIDGTDAHGGPNPDPTYGDQFNEIAIYGVNPEGKINVAFEYVNGTYKDGTTYQLRKPVYSFSNLNYGSMASDVKISPRVGNQIIGLGLLEAISESDILAYADEFDADGDGISGRANYVWDIESQSNQLGRFGWKSNQPSVLQQVAAAFVGDMGIKSYLFPNENYTSNQSDLDTLANGGDVEIEADDLHKVVVYASSLAVPARRNVTAENITTGKELFNNLGCVKCHVDSYSTASTHELSYLNNQLIHPYSDLLLHDMGEGLADNRPDYLANGNEWRTQPLWGIGLIETVNGHTYLLHDGRARSIEEAILWHGGEALDSKNKFVALSAEDRQFVLDFLNSL